MLCGLFDVAVLQRRSGDAEVGTNDPQRRDIVEQWVQWRSLLGKGDCVVVPCGQFLGRRLQRSKVGGVSGESILDCHLKVCFELQVRRERANVDVHLDAVPGSVVGLEGRF